MLGANMSTSNPNVSHFSKVLPLSIRKEVVGNFNGGGDTGGQNTMGSSSVGGGGGREQREFVRITINFPSQSCGTMNPHKEIALRLTNDDNPLFYYHLRVTDAEFPQLRLQQGLLVDFYGFPTQLISLLEKCDLNSATNCSSNNNDRESDDHGVIKSSASFGSGPKFILVLKIMGGNTVLDIVESNPFKYLCHLSLQVNPGTDAEVKNYLCDVTSTLKKDYQLLSEKYNHLSSTMEAEITRIKAMFDNKCIELNQLREEVHTQATSLSTKHFQEMNQEKEKLLRLQSELVAKFDAERSEIDKRHKTTLTTLEERISALESENRDLSVCKFKQETALQDASNRLRVYEDDFKMLQQEITLARKQNAKLDQDYHEKQRLVNSLQNKNTILEEDLKEKQSMIHRQQEMINSLSFDKKRTEDNNLELTKELDKLKTSSKITAQELGKANEIIKKLQDDIRNSHSKSKLQALIMAEHEKNIQDRDKRLQELEKELSECKESLKSTQDELKEKSGELETSLKKIKEQEGKLQSNDNMISWLNKQLNELQGLSDLSKFRANLTIPGGDLKNPQKPPSSRQEQILSSKVISARPPISSASNNMRQKTHTSHIHELSSNINDNNNINNNNNTTTGGDLHHRPPPYSNNNTMQGQSPSWLHIYQSTTTPNDHDLSTRLEHISALGAILNSQSQLKSSNNNTNNPVQVGGRHEDQSHSTTTANKNTNDVRNTGGGNNKGASTATTKQPTWAQNKPKVTLDTMINKPTFPIWKNK